LPLEAEPSDPCARLNTKRAGRNECARASVLSPFLVTEPQVLNQLTVRIDVRPSQIVQEPATFAYHLQEATATVVVFAVLAEMFREVVDAFGQDRYLNLGRARIRLVDPMLLNRRCFIECHCFETAVP
jgi:hypothetical protein